MGLMRVHRMFEGKYNYFDSIDVSIILPMVFLLCLVKIKTEGNNIIKSTSVLLIALILVVRSIQ